MHRSYAFPVRHLLREGDNRLRVRFDSAYRYARDLAERLGGRPNEYPEPFNFIRKMACDFGWDWGPNVVTAGIWRPIGRCGWRTARLGRVRAITTRDSVVVAGARMAVTVAPDAESALLNLPVAGPGLWWPRGYGEQRRHLLDVTLCAADATVLDTWRRRVGFRSVRVDTTPDADGTPFTLMVNDVPVYVRGANWIPDDPHRHRPQHPYPLTGAHAHGRSIRLPAARVICSITEPLPQWRLGRCRPGPSCALEAQIPDYGRSDDSCPTCCDL
jgi:beta-mannosidase